MIHILQIKLRWKKSISQSLLCIYFKKWTSVLLVSHEPITTSIVLYFFQQTRGSLKIIIIKVLLLIIVVILLIYVTLTPNQSLTHSRHVCLSINNWYVFVRKQNKSHGDERTAPPNLFVFQLTVKADYLNPSDNCFESSISWPESD